VFSSVFLCVLCVETSVSLRAVEIRHAEFNTEDTEDAEEHGGKQRQKL